jgi:glycosyltransferase involved in cell wall biosynthesis
MRAAAIIPVLNEVATIGAVVRELPREAVDEVVVADGGSTDGTREAAVAGGARVIEAGRGYGRACAAGVAATEAGILLFLDGDGADRADLAGRLVEPLRRGEADFTIASRTRGEREPGSMLWHQVLAGQVAGMGIGLLTGTRYTDMCAFRAITRPALARLALREMTYGWNIEMQMQAARAGLRIREIPLPYRCRAGGESKVAGSVRGTLRAGGRIVATFARVAASPRPASQG